VIGATSAIAEAVERLFATKGARLYLVARNAQRLGAIESDLKVRGAALVAGETLDLTDHAAHAGMIDRAVQVLGGLDAVLIAHGTLPDQRKCQSSLPETMAAIEVNALSVISLLTILANVLEKQGHGVMAVISSVAGDRGRKSNYVYGSAKAMVSAFLSGLRQRLSKTGVRVVTIKPGFVDTPMTRDFKKGALWAKPEDIAPTIARAMEKANGTLYVSWIWRYIMLVIRHIPEFIFRRLPL